MSFLSDDSPTETGRPILNMTRYFLGAVLKFRRCITGVRRVLFDPTTRMYSKACTAYSTTVSQMDGGDCLLIAVHVNFESIRPSSLPWIVSHVLEIEAWELFVTSQSLRLGETRGSFLI